MLVVARSLECGLFLPVQSHNFPCSFPSSLNLISSFSNLLALPLWIPKFSVLLLLALEVFIPTFHPFFTWLTLIYYEDSGKFRNYFLQEAFLDLNFLG